MAAIITADQGDDDAARLHADRGWTRARTLGQLVLTAWAQNASGVAALRRGDVDGALDWYERCLALVRDTENRVCRHLVMAGAAEAYLRAGRHAEASLLAAQAVELGESAKSAHFRAMGRRIEAELLFEQHRYDEGGRVFDEVVATFMAQGSALELARARLRRGELLLARGEERDAAEGNAEIARADEAFASLGALPDRALVERVKSRVTPRDAE